MTQPVPFFGKFDNFFEGFVQDVVEYGHCVDISNFMQYLDIITLISPTKWLWVNFVLDKKGISFVYPFSILYKIRNWFLV